jgi:magnesium chelatase subunit I
VSIKRFGPDPPGWIKTARKILPGQLVSSKTGGTTFNHMTRPQTLGELRRSSWAEPPLRGRSVRDEVRGNLLRALEGNEPLFPGIVGYEDTIIPQLTNALLARHHFILLGLRGQAKSRILRQLVRFLDEAIPIVAGSEVNDDPFAPISRYARERLAECGDATAIAWLPREQRFVEKLATPDVTIADLIGDVDPIKAARGGHLLSDELTMHFGLLPRANRAVFAINELPDLSGKVQVGLFNIMQEGDVQIKGYPVRLPLDVLLAFTANPEDYTARGKIITPLKDRIGSEIITHYPRTVDLGMAITAQEAWTRRGGRPVTIPDWLLELIERVAFAARADKRVDRRSGVSQRLPISVLEHTVSSAERRALTLGEALIVPRVSDVYAAVPSITGKLELEYEGELQGGETIARELIRKAAGETLDERAGGFDFEPIVSWFDQGGALQMDPEERAEICLKAFAVVPGLARAAADTGLAGASAGEVVAACELILEGLVAHQRISRTDDWMFARARPERREPGKGKGFQV